MALGPGTRVGHDEITDDSAPVTYANVVLHWIDVAE